MSRSRHYTARFSSFAKPLVFLILLASCGCTRGGPAPAPGLEDSLGVIDPAQGARINALIRQIGEKHALAIYVRTQRGVAPETAGPLLSKAKPHSLVLMLYPLSGAYRFERPGGDARQNVPPQSWDRALGERIEAALAQSSAARLGDAVELSLKDLDAILNEPEESSLSEPAWEQRSSLRHETTRVRRDAPPTLPGLSASEDPDAQSEPEAAYLMYLTLARAGDTRSDLKLYTQETRTLLRENPIRSGELKRVAEKYAGAPYEIAVLDERAVVHFPMLDLTYVPFFIVREKSGWRLDLTAGARMIETSPRGLWSFKPSALPDNPYLFAFRDYFIDENGYVHYRR